MPNQNLGGHNKPEGNFYFSQCVEGQTALEEASKINEGKIINANVVTCSWKVKRVAELLELIMIEESYEERQKNLGSIQRLSMQCPFRKALYTGSFLGS